MDVVWKPTEEKIQATRISQWMKRLGFANYDDFFQASIENIAWFWQEVERELGIQWSTAYQEVVNLNKGIKWPDWFVEGKLNIVQTAIEKWANQPNTSSQPAVTWESEDGIVQTYTFSHLNDRVNRVATGFKKMGISKGDIVAIYMPMIPETVIAMLAIAKLGAITTPVFSGYGADAVAVRLNAANAKMIITADGFMRRGQVVSMKTEADRALDLAPSVNKMVVVKRIGIDTAWDVSRDIDWNQLITQDPLVETIAMESADPLMILFTSGTTGRPKGALHTHAGFPIKAAFDAGIGMDVRQGDRLFWYTDMGWMMGPFLLYGGLINGATILLYEGTPDFPNPDRIWELVAKHQVTHLGISPTLIRSLMKHGVKWPKKHARNMKSLRVIGSTGEPWNPEPWLWLFEKVGNRNLPIMNYSGGTEISGGILGNVLIRPISPITFNSPLPGMDVDVWDQRGKTVVNQVGELVLKQPWVGMTHGFWQEPVRYEESYWGRWPNIWVHGDWVKKDEAGYWTITGRSDDTLNIAGKRIGPAEMESILVEDSRVVESGVIGIPDEVKGEVAVCFVVLKENDMASNYLREQLLSVIANKLGKALRPKELHFVSDLPKTRNAKVMRRAIKSAYLGRELGDLSALENREILKELWLLGKNNWN